MCDVNWQGFAPTHGRDTGSDRFHSSWHLSLGGPGSAPRGHRNQAEEFIGPPPTAAAAAWPTPGAGQSRVHSREDSWQRRTCRRLG